MRQPCGPIQSTGKRRGKLWGNGYPHISFSTFACLWQRYSSSLVESSLPEKAESNNFFPSLSFHHFPKPSKAPKGLRNIIIMPSRPKSNVSLLTGSHSTDPFPSEHSDITTAMLLSLWKHSRSCIQQVRKHLESGIVFLGEEGGIKKAVKRDFRGEGEEDGGRALGSRRGDLEAGCHAPAQKRPHSISRKRLGPQDPPRSLRKRLRCLLSLLQSWTRWLELTLR